MDKTTIDLGLPIEYKQLPQFFDAHNIGENTDNKNKIIETLLRNHNTTTVSDMTCGTGSQVIHEVRSEWKHVQPD